MKKLLPIIVTVALLIVLLVVTFLSEQLIGKSRLEQVATIPDYAPNISDNIVATEPADKEREEAPIVTLTDGQGNTVTLDQFRGKTVVMNFWASWSTPSYRELAMYQKAYEDYQGEVVFLMINTTSDQRETREAADKMIADGGYTFPVYYDTDASVATTYEVISLPTSFFIDANGKGIAYAAGELSRANLEVGLRLCRENVEREGGIHATAPTTPVDGTDPTEETVSEED